MIEENEQIAPNIFYWLEKLIDLLIIFLTIGEQALTKIVVLYLIMPPVGNI